MEGFLRYLFGGLMEGLMHGGRYFRNFTVLFIIIIVIYIYAYKRNVVFLGQGKIRKVCKWSGKGIGVVKV